MKSCHSKSNLIVSCPRLSVRLPVCVSRHVARPHPSGRCMYATQILLLHFCLWSLTHRGREKVCFAVWGQQSAIATSLDRLGLGLSHLHSHSHLVLIFMLSTRIVFATLYKPSELSINPNSIAMRLSDPLRGSASCNCCHSEILHKAQFRGKLRQQLRLHDEKRGVQLLSIASLFLQCSPPLAAAHIRIVRNVPLDMFIDKSAGGAFEPPQPTTDQGPETIFGRAGKWIVAFGICMRSCRHRICIFKTLSKQMSNRSMAIIPNTPL